MPTKKKVVLDKNLIIFAVFLLIIIIATGISLINERTTKMVFVVDGSDNVVIYESEIEKPIDIERYGYNLLGWFENPKDESTIIIFPHTFEGTLTVYPKWELNGDLLLPLISLETKNHVDILRKDRKIKTYISIDNTDEEFKFEKQKAEVNVRGNTTALPDKKPYRVEFENPVSMLGLADGVAYKKWVLLADYFDPTGMRNYIAQNIAKNLSGLQYAPDVKHVELELNGEYKGLYLLVEFIEVDENKISFESNTENSKDENINYYIEIDGSAYLEGFEGLKWFAIDTKKYDILYPKNDDLSRNRVRFIKQKFINLNKAFKDLAQGKIGLDELSKIVDIDSFVDFFILNEFTYNFDSDWKSCKLTYDAKLGKIFFGPAWDFDLTYGIPWQWEPFTSYEKTEQADEFLFFNKTTSLMYFAKQNEELMQIFKNRYHEFTVIQKEVFNSAMDYAETILPTIYKDAEIWYGNTEIVDGNFAFIKEFMNIRANFFDTYFGVET